MPEVILNMPVSYYSGQRLANFPVHLNETFASTVHSIKASRTQNRVRFIKDLTWNKCSVFVRKITKYAFGTTQTTLGNEESICEMSHHGRI